MLLFKTCDNKPRICCQFGCRLGFHFLIIPSLYKEMLCRVFSSTTISPAIRLSLAFVPEQVNIPIHLANSLRIFEKHNVKVEMKIVPEGTGKMLSMLEDGEVDLALTVTDGFIVGKQTKKKVSLAGTFVQSSLVWAVAAAATPPLSTSSSPPSSSSSSSSSIAKLEDLKQLHRPLRFGVSRLGSGSHTMGIYTGLTQLGLEQKDIAFVVANTFQGLRDGVSRGDFDVFMWETFTTKPWFDRRELTHVGDVSTPWPAFSFVSGSSMTTEKASAVRHRLFPALSEAVELFASPVPAARADAIARIVRDHGHTPEDAALWLTRVRYAGQGMPVSKAGTQKSVDALARAQLVPKENFSVQTLWENNPVIQFIE